MNSKITLIAIRYLSILFLLLSIFSCTNNKIDNNSKENDDTIINNDSDINDDNNNDNQEIKKQFKYDISLLDEGKDIYNISKNSDYNYGPSIIKNEDGSYDAWFSRPGNNGSQWDWINYRHSEDGFEWTNQVVVLKPTPGSEDQCSVCDPGVIFFNDYYYLGYTSTNDYTAHGSNNSLFVARSQYPDGPYEKWNGESWGGNPEPIIEYEGNPSGWGNGEVSFVIKDDELYIYYTEASDVYISTDLAKAELSENWPATINHVETAYVRVNNDSLDVVYDDNTGMFLAFTIDIRMSEGSKMLMLKSKDGINYEYADQKRTGIEDYAHNIGISKDINGHINSNDDLLVCYAYGSNWGRWTTKVQTIKINSELVEITE